MVPVRALVQAYSVMTRMPRGYRVAPDVARDALRDAFAERADLVAQDSAGAWALLDRAALHDVAGGGIYDPEVLACAERAGAKRLLTLNPSDFPRLGPTDVEMVVP